MADAPRVLVAGIGNLFLGDDGFGVEVAQRLAREAMPEGARVVDYGIRGFDLAYAILDGPEWTVMVDATGRGDAPGSLYVIEADTSDAAAVAEVQGHVMNPAAVFSLVRAMGGTPGQVVVVGCEPETLGPEDVGQMGLSDTVAAVIPDAVELVKRVVDALLTDGDLSSLHNSGAEARHAEARTGGDT